MHGPGDSFALVASEGDREGVTSASRHLSNLKGMSGIKLA